MYCINFYIIDQSTTCDRSAREQVSECERVRTMRESVGSSTARRDAQCGAESLYWDIPTKKKTEIL